MHFKEYILLCFINTKNDYFIEYIKEVDDYHFIFEDILNYLPETKKNIYILGTYGVGKTLFINKIKYYCNYNFIEINNFNTEIILKPDLFIIMSSISTMSYLLGLELYNKYSADFNYIKCLKIRNKLDCDFFRLFPSNNNIYDISVEYDYGLKEISDIINYFLN